MKSIILLIFATILSSSVFDTINSIKENKGCDIIKTKIASIDTLETSLLFRCSDSTGEIHIEVDKNNLGKNISKDNKIIFSLISYDGTKYTAESAYSSTKNMGRSMMGGASQGSRKSPHGSSKGSMGMGGSPHGMGKAKSSIEKIDVKAPAGGYSVVDLYGSLDKLSGTDIKVSGQVVKFSPNIMGTNWLHIQDGTGASSSNNLVIRTAETFEVGSVVTISGELQKDYELAQGMVYDVIIFDGKSIK
jgi:hypothetical protein